jgi:hypothetical protein
MGENTKAIWTVENQFKTPNCLVLVFAFIGFLNSCTGLCIASLIFSLIGPVSNPGGNGRVASTGVVFLIICCVSSIFA